MNYPSQRFIGVIKGRQHICSYLLLINFLINYTSQTFQKYKHSFKNVLRSVSKQFNDV